MRVRPSSGRLADIALVFVRFADRLLLHRLQRITLQHQRRTGLQNRGGEQKSPGSRLPPRWVRRVPRRAGVRGCSRPAVTLSLRRAGREPERFASFRAYTSGSGPPTGDVLPPLARGQVDFHGVDAVEQVLAEQLPAHQLVDGRLVAQIGARPPGWAIGPSGVMARFWRALSSLACREGADADLVEEEGAAEAISKQPGRSAGVGEGPLPWPKFFEGSLEPMSH